MKQSLSLGYSPCPNDTFIFYALTHGRVALPEFKIAERLEDVETLNQLARCGTLELTKISYHAFGHLRDRYVLLRSGGALGRGCGPLVIARQPGSMANLRGKTLAIPGELTTANLLLQLYAEGFEQVRAMPFDRIMPAVANGSVAAGVIIHESRFTYQQFGLHKIIDLGAWWEAETGSPIPLGGILARRDLGSETIRTVERAIAASLDYAWQHPEEPRNYIRQHAQELDDEVIDQHIGLYVNDFSRALGPEGVAAVTTLFEKAESRGLIPTSYLPLFVD
jgi:5,8-dihydroxy-2-naphthoate synthase